jgi:hypothetical protein
MYTYTKTKGATMTSNYAKANKLREAFELLDRAHAIVQDTVGDTDNSYESAWEQLEEVLKDYYDNLIEMQITD